MATILHPCTMHTKKERFFIIKFLCVCSEIVQFTGIVAIECFTKHKYRLRKFYVFFFCFVFHLLIPQNYKWDIWNAIAEHWKLTERSCRFEWNYHWIVRVWNVLIHKFFGKMRSWQLLFSAVIEIVFFRALILRKPLRKQKCNRQILFEKQTNESRVWIPYWELKQILFRRQRHIKYKSKRFEYVGNCATCTRRVILSPMKLSLNSRSMGSMIHVPFAV